MTKPMSATEDYTEYYDERDYWWNLMEQSAQPVHPSPNIPTVIFRNKEGSDWDYDTFGHGG